ARDGKLTEAMTQRFLTLATYAVGTGAAGILFTCSAFGPCIEAVQRAFPKIPVLKPNEAMVEEAVEIGGTIGLMASFGPTLVSMPPEFPASIKLVPKLIEGAMDALNRGDGAEHHRLAGEAAKELDGCDAIALAQFSLARAANAVAQASGRPVLTTPHSAVRKLKSLLA
ncbi:MAG: aspartate/glutamate racemase family protein, partial [Bosea sp. (in: a-proteobacteria)]